MLVQEIPASLFTHDDRQPDRHTVMGGMNSISVNDAISVETEPRPASVPDCATSEKVYSPPLERGDRTPHLIPIARAGEVSPWVLSGCRRLLDCTIALAALIGFAPVMLIAAALVRLGSRGPILFRQGRMGRQGKEFTLYKFRSMRDAEGEGSSITVMGDARITRVGALLRRYKLDELPQFWNVLRGDMGLVGPRPKLPRHEALHLPCRPGITGVATLAFHGEEEFLSGIPEEELEAFYQVFVKPAKAHLDLEYMQTATLWSDCAILWRTASSCLFGGVAPLAVPADAIARHAAGGRRAPAGHPVPTHAAVAASSGRTHESRMHEGGIRVVSLPTES
jgi:lipopolysaccharide/colanic/teichoic acid biosynthesis glycosyltransferase